MQATARLGNGRALSSHAHGGPGEEEITVRDSRDHPLATALPTA